MLQDAVKARIQQGICGGLTKNQRDVVIKWIDFLLDPNRLNPSTDNEKRGVQDLGTHLGKNKPLLNYIRKATINCPP